MNLLSAYQRVDWRWQSMAHGRNLATAVSGFVSGALLEHSTLVCILLSVIVFMFH